MRFALLTLSDRAARHERPDAAGPALLALIAQQWPTAQVVRMEILPDDLATIRDTLREWCDAGTVDIVLTTGGTGFAARDVTPEATRAVLEREAPGLAEAMRAAALKITPHAMLSRAVCGLRGRCLIINLPGSPKAACENLAAIAAALPHAVQLLREAPEAEAGHRAEKPSR